ncbi:MAG: hypothetical protein Q4G66_06120 [bacterium]|nr:hypothetical protein [bacterium]
MKRLLYKFFQEKVGLLLWYGFAVELFRQGSVRQGRKGNKHKKTTEAGAPVVETTKKEDQAIINCQSQ